MVTFTFACKQKRAHYHSAVYVFQAALVSYHTVDVMLLSLGLVLMMHFCGLNEVFKL